MNPKNNVLDLERKLLEKEDRLQQDREALDHEKQSYRTKLEHLAGLTVQEAKKALLEEIEREETAAVARIIKEKEEAAKLGAEKLAREVLVEAMRHGALDYIAEYTVSIIKVADEEVKGRIIGKEGRNIRAFEKATGVDIDLD